MSKAEHSGHGNQQAITTTVTGQQIQKVGFRAMVQKQAIVFNLAGSARNNPDETVSVTLQGDAEEIANVVAAMKAGSKKSSKNNVVAEAPAEVDPNLKTFTVINWISTSRNITTPYNLVFTLRSPDSGISAQQAKSVWNGIAESTLKGDDLIKFKQHLDDDSE
jgi:acylphosphatase